MTINKVFELNNLQRKELENNFTKYVNFIDFNNILFQIHSFEDVELRKAGIMGEKMLFMDCDGKLYNCLASLNKNIGANCKNCEMFTKECISLWEMF